MMSLMTSYVSTINKQNKKNTPVPVSSSLIISHKTLKIAKT